MDAEAAAYNNPDVLAEWPNLAGSKESVVGGGKVRSPCMVMLYVHAPA